jgi:hypothetical protein
MENLDPTKQNETISEISRREFWIKFGGFLKHIFKIYQIKFTLEIWKL